MGGEPWGNDGPQRWAKREEPLEAPRSQNGVALGTEGMYGDVAEIVVEGLAGPQGHCRDFVDAVPCRSPVGGVDRSPAGGVRG